jgi:hypothetical protein
VRLSSASGLGWCLAAASGRPLSFISLRDDSAPRSGDVLPATLCWSVNESPAGWPWSFLVRRPVGTFRPTSRSTRRSWIGCGERCEIAGVLTVSSASRNHQPRLPWVTCTWGCPRPSDTNPKYMGCPSRDVHPREAAAGQHLPVGRCRGGRAVVFQGPEMLRGLTYTARRTQSL